MTIAISDDHLELATTARRWVSDRVPMTVTRRHLEAVEDERPVFWDELVELGWLGLAVSEANGGSGYGLAELAVVLEELGRVCAPGPFLATAAAAIAIDRWGTDPTLLGPLLDGTQTAGIAVAPGGPVWGGQLADVVVVPLVGDSGWTWVVLDATDVTLEPIDSFDQTRRLASITMPETLDPDIDRLLDCDAGSPVGLMTVLASAEACGISGWALECASTYAKDRIQFGRPIGQFQGVKHRCADMAVRHEAACAVTWDAARAWDARDEGWQIAVDAAGALAPEAGFRNAQDCIQVLGGIGYTWEHDAHLFLKRATASAHLLPAASVWRGGLAGLVRTGNARSTTVDLPVEAEAYRPVVKAFIEDLQDRPKAEWNDAISDAGYLVPHWPAPYGLDATPLQQLVIDQEFAAARLRRRHLQVAGWALPTIIAHGTADQQQCWVGPSLRGELMWCQMFSEPGAGSDLASLTTRATRVDGGWSITGQKVWTSMAQWAQWAICLARTDPDAPRHDGIGCFMIDMTSPGIELRPLKELTGLSMFNEVFLTEVFVPDDCLVGGPTEGWSAARTTLANERVSMGQGASFGPGVQALFDLAEERGRGSDPLFTDTLGGIVATSHAAAMLGVRSTLRAIGGGQPGPEASVRKLLGVEHEQHIQEVGLDLLGPDAARTDGPSATWIGGFLGNRALSIAGGTSEIQRNVIAERILGLPKDP